MNDQSNNCEFNAERLVNPQATKFKVFKKTKAKITKYDMK